jgi:chromosome segregation ATPase
MDMISFIILSIISAATIIGFIFLIKSKTNSGIGQERKELKQTLAQLDEDLNVLGKQSNQLISKKQLEGIREKRAKLAEQVTEARALLIDLEAKLKSTQDSVKEKEEKQQALKAAKIEEENKLADVVASYEVLSGESVKLEKNLAESMRQLDSLENEVQMTDKQKDALHKLSAVLSGAGERMRELITEYEAVHQKVVELQKQYVDLEDEYKRLVEQQISS